MTEQGTSTHSLTVFTIGHGPGTFSGLERRLAAHRVQTIIDVRSQPHSARFPDFTKHALTEASTAAGLGYRWLGDRLGGRPDDPALVDVDGQLDHARVTASEEFRSAIEEVLALARSSTVVLMCAEVEPAQCHRTSLIAPALISRKTHVIHILGDGSARPYEFTLGI